MDGSLLLLLEQTTSNQQDRYVARRVRRAKMAASSQDAKSVTSRSSSPRPSVSKSRSPSRSRSRSPSRSRSLSRSLTTDEESARSLNIASIRVTGMTPLVYSCHLEEIFGAYGTIEEIVLPLFTRSGEPKGHAWIEFRSADAAKEAIRCMHKGQIDGAIVRCGVEDMPRMDSRAVGYAEIRRLGRERIVGAPRPPEYSDRYAGSRAYHDDRHRSGQDRASYYDDDRRYRRDYYADRRPRDDRYAPPPPPPRRYEPRYEDDSGGPYRGREHGTHYSSDLPPRSRVRRRSPRYDSRSPSKPRSRSPLSPPDRGRRRSVSEDRSMKSRSPSRARSRSRSRSGSPNGPYRASPMNTRSVTHRHDDEMAMAKGRPRSESRSRSRSYSPQFSASPVG